MSSAGAQCRHINHVSTQLPYAMTVAGVSFVSYIIAGLIQTWISLPIAIVLMLATLFVLKAVLGKRAFRKTEPYKSFGLRNIPRAFLFSPNIDFTGKYDKMR